jgi:hypothetical protein
MQKEIRKRGLQNIETLILFDINTQKMGSSSISLQQVRQLEDQAGEIKELLKRWKEE